MLRDSPLITYRGVHTWPPAWMWAGKGEPKTVRGEIGSLNEVHPSIADPGDPSCVRPFNRIYLFIEYQNAEYLGCLLFDDPAACRQIAEILSHQCGRLLSEIGDLDLGRLF